jgi:hypothetical protein
MLVRLLYASRAVDTSPEAINAILAQSRLHNPESGITGILCYGGGIFHADVVLLHYEEISERRFGGWTMGQVDTSRINASILLKYAEKPELDPYSVSGKVSLALLEELMATASIIGRA